MNGHDVIKDVCLTVAMQPNNTVYEDDWQKGIYGFLWPKNKEETAAVLDRAIELKQSGYKINNSIAHLKAIKGYINAPDAFVKKTSCNMDKALHISSIGNVYHCYEFDSLGNIKKDDITKILASEKAERIRQQIRNCRKNCHFLINCYYEED